MDIPSEVFSCLSEGIIQHTNFGHEWIESNTRLIFKIKDIGKANYLFARMDIDGAEVDRNSLLKKKFQDSLERCEVIVTEDKAMELKFNKSSEVLMLLSITDTGPSMVSHSIKHMLFSVNVIFYIMWEIIYCNIPQH